MWQPPIYKTGFVRSVCARHLYILPFNIYIHFISTQMKNETTITFNLWLWYVIFGSWSFVCVFKQTVVLRCSFFIFQKSLIRYSHSFIPIEHSRRDGVDKHTQFIHTPKFCRNVWKKKKKKQLRTKIVRLLCATMNVDEMKMTNKQSN